MLRCLKFESGDFFGMLNCPSVTISLNLNRELYNLIYPLHNSMATWSHEEAHYFSYNDHGQMEIE